MHSDGKIVRSLDGDEEFDSLLDEDRGAEDRGAVVNVEDMKLRTT